jgi:hypothetical protein
MWLHSGAGAGGGGLKDLLWAEAHPNVSWPFPASACKSVSFAQA